jgi:hypothetical protein
MKFFSFNNTLSFRNRIILFVIGIIAMTIGIFTSCVKQDFDTPPVIVPRVTFKSNLTIDSLKRYYALTPHPGAIDTIQITDTLIIQGVVNSTDESGNIYKNLYIQDSTGGIVLSIDQPNLYTMYKLGQRVYIKMQGLYMGTYGGAVEIGYRDYNGTSIGRIPPSMLSTHIYPDSLPGNAPTPIVIDPKSNTIGKYLDMLVDVPKVTFPDAGQPFVTGDVTTNRNVADSIGTVIVNGSYNFIIRTSNYASFCNNLLPAGVGTLRGILSIYNGQYQMYVRDMNDLVKFDTSGIGPVATTIYQNNFDASPTDWVEYAANGNNWTFDGSYQVMVANGYSGSEPTDCYLISPGIDLTGYTETILNFKMWTKYTDSGLANPFEAKISTNYSGSGDPTTATWSTLNCIIPAQNSATWTSSGDVDLSAYNQKVYIMFHYKSSGTTSSTASKWEVDSFKVTGKH